MFTIQFAHKYYHLWRALQHLQCISPAGFILIEKCRPSSGWRYNNIIPVSFTAPTNEEGSLISNRTMAIASESSINLCNKNTNVTRGVRRAYEVVVAATRDMGIGKDGKLPWTLPSDLRYFKEITTTTSVAGNRNAVIMGRRTWESIPENYRPLPGRLNVVLSRSGELGLATQEDLVICRNLDSALVFLGFPLHGLSVEKVFVIGGGQVLKEALNGPGCEAIHLTDIHTSIECDTFIPQIDSSLFLPLHSSKEMVENSTTFSFLTYVRSSDKALFSSETEINDVNAGYFHEMRAKFDYLKQIQEKIAGSCTV